MRTVLLAVAVILAGCGSQSPPPVEARSPEPAAKAPASEVSVKPEQAGIAVETVRDESVPEVIRATGRLTVNENHTWRVGAITEARVVKVAVNPGDKVTAGQVLARMHSHDVHEGRAEYRKALNELSRARAAEGYAKQIRDRAKRLYALKAAALEQVERTEAEVKNAQAAVELAETELERAKTHLVEFLQVTLDEPDKHSDEGPHTGESHGDEDLIPVKSPAAGTVLERKVTAGSVVAVATEMFVISDLSTLWMQANIAEASITHVRPGQSVRVEVQAQPGRSFAGRVIKLNEQLDPATRTLPVRIELANPGGLLKPEMYADAQLSAGGTQRAMYVSESALQEIKGQTVVFVETAPGQYDARAVETGRSLDGRVALLHGVTAGDKVVVKGAFILKSQLLKKSLSEEE